MSEPNPIDEFFRNLNRSKVVVAITALLLIGLLFAWGSKENAASDAYGDCLAESIRNDTSSSHCQP